MFQIFSCNLTMSYDTTSPCEVVNFEESHMKLIGKGLVAASLVSVIVSASAFADVAGLRAKFKGGGLTANTTGNVYVGVVASGTDLATEGVQLWVAEGPGKSFRKVSNRVKPLSATGYAEFKVKNTPGGCYKVATAPNGNDKPDHVSNTICEK